MSVATRLAGVTDTLRKLADDNEGNSGNILHMLADVCEHANERICRCSDDVDAENKGGAA